MITPLRLLACFLCLGGLDIASASESFPFWPGKGVKAAAGFQRLEGHPCGEVAIAKVSRLPNAKNGPLLSEDVVEFDRRGKVIRRWPIPVDYSPRAVRREELLVVAGSKGFWVRSNGAFRKAKTIPVQDNTQRFKCDDPKSALGESPTAGCGTFIDLASRKKRTLSSQDVCS